MDSLVTVQGFSTLAEALLAQGRLHAHGIDAHVPDHHSAGIVGDLVAGSAGIRLQVSTGDLEHARELLGLHAVVAPRAPEVANTPCPACGAPCLPVRRLPVLGRLVRSRKLRCSACGHDPRTLA